ncbi:uroporphyrin-III C-methyltransferase / precorrin-2 dehydrogenase / sirohydrochlorin ferrochelatase [Litoreibacter ascidiaceicola]|uniref:Uroporphyrin-III C-methyltransferase / precorrin-2 dehydrogenase / sirohydrochlorin ferrochelatase n=1 Tax=Litoreibacter ascidiaceicola TaxID=1486859 RepID=A0A1M4VG33_9RHOB|nr:siroheme synthase CysG [Litoreibacter ascidiaceicola]SHE67921.1 uroporphyrin-III C-methyltransferase / precorrin-2 dehydrogenase / sirohydrochlorin ferrochelatase [Litoreibacter ascidiaceicola]
MKHFPIFISLEGRRVVVSGGGEAALAKLRLLLKTEANLTVVASDPAPEIVSWAAEGRLTLIARPMEVGDALCARLFYAANEDDTEDARVADIANREGALVNIVDNLEDSQFITPAMVDRDPVVVAIGTEGAAPVLARAIKKDIEERLSPRLGLMARIGKAFRTKAEALPFGVKRREFWAEYYAKDIATSEDAKTTLDALLDKHLSAHAKEGRVDLVGAGPGDPELMTLKARKALDEADVVIYDRLVAPEILELARREAIMLSAGKEGFGPSVTQDAINEMIVSHARNGAHVVRLKSGDPTVFGRLDEEIEACDASGVAWSIVPGITSASAAVAALGQSFTKRGRNSGVRFITGHDTKGFADHDWKTLARAGEVAAIYMGKKSARFIQGRLLMHGADALTQVTVIENASRPDQRILATTLGELEPTLTQANLTGPALVFLGLAPRAALNAAQQHELEAAI